MSKFNRYKRSIGRFLRKAFHRPKANISRGSIIIAITLAIIFFASLALRLVPLIDAQPIVRAFDPWFQLKVTEHIVENGYGAFFGWYDAYTWMPFGRDIGGSTYVGVPFTSAFFYFVANGLGIPVSVTYVSILMPALLGALTTIAAFFLGREISNNSVGLLSALFMGFMPAFLQRTIAGFYDNECIGVFAIVLTMFFFTRSIKRNSLPSAVGAGLSLAYLLGSWGAADFLLDLLALYAFVLLIAGRYSKRLLSSYLTTVSIGLFVGGLVPRNGFSNLTQFSTLVPIGVAALLALYEVWLRVESYRKTTAEALSPHMKPLLLAIGAPVIAAASYFIYSSGSELDISTANSNPILTIGGKFLTVINPFYRLDQRIFASVAEHLPTSWSSFYTTLLVIIFFIQHII
jgi:dolichyl-diphosphooligosaccharide--protein glycosyltransferase